MADTSSFAKQTAGGDSLVPTAVLKILFGKERGKRFELQGSRFTLGKGDQCDIQLSEPSLADLHGIIILGPNWARIQDVGTVEGIRINGRIVNKEAALISGSQIEMGGVVIAFSRDVEEEVDQPGPAAQEHEPRKEAPQDLPPIYNRPVSPGRALVDDSPVIRQVVSSSAGPEPQVRKVRIKRQAWAFKFISWLVILGVAILAVWVGTTLLKDLKRLPRISTSSAESQASAGRRENLKKIDVDEIRRNATKELLVKEQEEYQPPTIQAPDTTRDLFDSAMGKMWGGDLTGALRQFEELKRDFPDFRPPFGESMDEIIRTVSEKIKYRELLTRAATLSADSSATMIELEQVLLNLRMIPVNDRDFGPASEALRRDIEARMSNKDWGRDRTRFNEDPSTRQVPPVQEETEQPATGKEAPAPQASTSTFPEDVMAAGREHYIQGNFAEASELFGKIYDDVSQAEPVRSKGRFLQRKTLEFSRDLEQGLALVGTDPAGAVALLEKAAKLDRKLFNYYQKVINKGLGDCYSSLAAAQLDRGNLAKARRSIEQGRKLWRDNPAWSELEARILKEAAKTLELAKTRFDDDQDGARRLLKDIVASTPQDSIEYRRAASMLVALDPESK